MPIFLCPVQDCGRRFKEEDKLHEHMQRRHGDMQNLKDISNLPLESNKNLEEIIEQKKEDILQQEKHLQEELARFDEKEEEIKISAKDILESKKKLTSNFILEKSGSDSLEEVTQLILREEGLYLFESTPSFNIDKIGGIEYLSLSHNRIINLMGVSRLVNLIELNINFNLVEDLSPLSECLNLEKLYASNNRIKNILGIKELTNLKVLVLFKNKIKDFNETVQVLASLPDLKELDLDQNPCTRTFTYKYDLLYHVRVEKLDGERIHEIDYELAKSFKKDGNKNAREQQDQGNTPLQRPSTAPGRMKKGFFVDKLKNSMKVPKFPELTGIPESFNHEHLEDLEQEVELLKKQKDELERVLDEMRTNEKLLKQENEKVKNENSILKVEASNAYILLDQNQQLKKELESLRTILGKNDDVKNIKEENTLLHEKFAEVLRENRELKAKLDKKSKRARGSSRDSDHSAERSDASNSSFTLESGRTNNFRIKTGLPSGPLTPKSRMIHLQSNSQQNTSRGGSVERPKVDIGSRKIIRVANPVKEKQEDQYEKQAQQDDEFSKEIENLLIRNSLQLSQIRSELRNFDFLETLDKSRVQYDDNDDEEIKVDDGDGELDESQEY